VPEYTVTLSEAERAELDQLLYTVIGTVRGPRMVEIESVFRKLRAAAPAEARVAILESRWAGVPWHSICDLLWAIDDREPGAMALKLWYDANHPQEATE